MNTRFIATHLRIIRTFECRIKLENGTIYGNNFIRPKSTDKESNVKIVIVLCRGKIHLHTKIAIYVRRNEHGKLCVFVK